MNTVRRTQVIAISVAGVIAGVFALIAWLGPGEGWWTAAGIAAGLCALIGVSFAFVGGDER